jgi:hypothetical protein
MVDRAGIARLAAATDQPNACRQRNAQQFATSSAIIHFGPSKSICKLNM